MLLLGVQGALLLVAPAISTDTFRYVHEARAQRSGLATPYREPPAVLAGDRTPLPDDGTSIRVEHRDVPAAYLPGSELLLLVTVAAGDVVGAPLLPFRIILLGGVVVVVWVLWRRGHAWRALLIAGQPLVLLESGLEAHLDGLTIPLLAATLMGSGVALGLLFHVKPVALLVLPFVPWRARIMAVVVAVVVAVPHLLAGVVVPPGLVAYGARWRAHPIGFGLIEAVVPTDVAKGIIGVAVVVVVVWVRRRWSPADPAGAVGLVLLAWLLLTPTLHPWYGLWLVVPAALTSSRPLRRGLWTFAALLPLLHQSDFARHSTGVWQEALWPRFVVVGGAVVAALSARFAQGADPGEQEAAAAQPQEGREIGVAVEQQKARGDDVQQAQPELDEGQRR